MFPSRTLTLEEHRATIAQIKKALRALPTTPGNRKARKELLSLYRSLIARLPKPAPKQAVAPAVTVVTLDDDVDSNASTVLLPNSVFANRDNDFDDSDDFDE